MALIASLALSADGPVRPENSANHFECEVLKTDRSLIKLTGAFAGEELTIDLGALVEAQDDKDFSLIPQGIVVEGHGRPREWRAGNVRRFTAVRLTEFAGHGYSMIEIFQGGSDGRHSGRWTIGVGMCSQTNLVAGDSQ